MAYSVKEIIDVIKENNSCTYLVLTLNGKEFASEFDVFSWRGSYDMPAVEFMENDYPMNIEERNILMKLENIHGTKVRGYKGGEFILDEDSILFFVLDESDSGDATAIVMHEVDLDTIYFYLEPDCY